MMIRNVLRLVTAVTWFALTTAHAAPGDLDTSFGAGSGQVLTAMGSEYDRAYAMALQADGKIVLAGLCRVSSVYRFCLARYQPNGVLDTTFNGTGKVITAVVGTTPALAYGVAVQTDGKIVATGQCGISNTTFCLVRYQPDGSLDATFNGNGIVSTPIGTAAAVATSIVLQPDGKIVVAGSCEGAASDFCLARYQTDGALDPAFNATGKVVFPVYAQDTAQAVALQADGKIVVAGTCNDPGVNFCLARFLTNGAPDTGFNGTGKVVTSFATNAEGANALAVQPDGKLVVAGYCTVPGGGSRRFCLARYLVNGTLDTTFNATGKVMGALTGDDDSATAVAVQPDGRIVAAGACTIAGVTNMCFARYLANGATDNSINGTGRAVATSSIDSNVQAVALQPDGKIVVAGYCFNDIDWDFCVGRFQSGRFDATSCTMDIDGDGTINATIDALLLTRVTLGIRGNVVLNGITFPVGASRTSWPMIRDYLVGLCGMTIAP